MDSVPMVVITGQVKRSAIGSDAFQETDITGITLHITKHNYLVLDAADVATTIKEAFHLATTGRPGPVLVDIPKDVQEELTEFEYPSEVKIEGYNPTNEGSAVMVRRAAKLINEAKRPVILSGHGVILSGAYGELISLAEKAQTPVIATLLGISSFPEDHFLYAGWPGMHGMAYSSLAIDESDLLIAIGMRFDDRITGDTSKFAPNAKVIHMDIDPSEIGKNINVDVPIVGDAKHILRQLIPLIEETSRVDWINRVETLKSEHPLIGVNDTDKLIPQFVINELYKATNGDAIVVTGVGQHQMWAAQYYKFNEPRTLVSSGGSGAMGFEVPAAMGAQLGRPDKTVWSICGDGGFQMTMCELATLAENKIPVKLAIINNGVLGMVHQWQESFYNKSYVATEYSANPDFVKLAEAFGLLGVRVSEKSEVAAGIAKAMDFDGPALIDFVVEEQENVYPFIPSGMSVADMIEGSQREKIRQ
jgi:acetolactate synthase-1/2/3 large subunit